MFKLDPGEEGTARFAGRSEEDREGTDAGHIRDRIIHHPEQKQRRRPQKSHQITARRDSPDPRLALKVQRPHPNGAARHLAQANNHNLPEQASGPAEVTKEPGPLAPAHDLPRRQPDAERSSLLHQELGEDQVPVIETSL